MSEEKRKGTIKVTLENNKCFEYEKGTVLEEISNDLYGKDKYPMVAAIVDNELRELSYSPQESCNIKFIDQFSSIGSRMYQRSLTFVFIRACKELYPDCKVSVEHSLSKGLYCEIHYEKPLGERDTERIEKRMKEIVEEDTEFVKNRVLVEEAIDIFRKYGQLNKVELMKYRKKSYVNIYQCGWIKNYFYGYMLPSTGYLKEFKLKHYEPGIIIRFPTAESNGGIPEFKEHPKLFRVFRETEKWEKILEVDYVASLNNIVVTERSGEFIHIAEALHEKKIAQIADMITEHEDDKKLILIAGPSSSGKTTFAKRLEIQLKVNGLRPVSISLDDYFVNREHTPLDENGELNFESLYSIDLKQFNEDLERILKGEEVEIPTFNFHIGEREYRGNKIKISKDQLLILEGIHGLNDELTRSIPRKDKFKIYISALTQLNIDEHNRVPTTDVRLIRRIVRDNKFRSNDASKTLSLWESVRRGEDENIFPFQEDADVMFNSALFYELNILKKYAEPLLMQIDKTNPYHAEAKRLLKFLDYFVELENEKEIPGTSILKEFIDGSSLY